MANIGFFDIPEDDVAQAKKFYRSLLGWTIEPATDFADKSQQRQNIITGKPENGTMNRGGLYKRHMPGPIMNFVIVEDLGAVLARVERLGGTIVIRKMRSGMSAVSRSSGTPRAISSASCSPRKIDRGTFFSRPSW
jgi:predicted enzyme related to lactoylglutathione lyase